MNIDTNTVVTSIFTLVDDIVKEPKILSVLKRPGVTPQLSDSEIITLAVYQELIGESREDHFFRLHGEKLRSFFPRLNERSRFNRRKRDLGDIICAVRISLGVLLRIPQVKQAVIDSAPVSVVGYKRDKSRSDFVGSAGYGFCSSKALRYFGYKFHSLVSLGGNIVDFVLTSTSPFDDQVVEEFVVQHAKTLEEIYGDKAYVSEYLKTTLRETMGILLFSPKKTNATTTTQHLTKIQGKARLMVETVNAQLQEQFHLSKHYAKSIGGLMTRIAAKVAAHTIGQLVNLLLGRPRLALASLAV